MKKYILLLVLMVMGTALRVYAVDVNPVKHGNMIRGHVIEKDTEDQRLQLDNVRIAHTDSSDPRVEEYGFGRAKIYVN